MTLRNALSLTALLLGSVALADDARPAHQLPPSPSGNLVVGLCDGKTSVEVKGKKPGDSLNRDEAQAVADQLMTEWKKKNPDAKWDDEVKLAQASPRSPPLVKSEQKPQAPNPLVKGKGETAETGAKGMIQTGDNIQSGHTYGAFSSRDEQIWAASTDEFVQRGKKVFHEAKELGSTVATSCDMCHPDAANTHPETYPKYQVQLGRVALLRDMINWCIENPVRGKPLKDDDEKLRAMEAYIYAQRKGVALEYGKH